MTLRVAQGSFITFCVCTYIAVIYSLGDTITSYDVFKRFVEEHSKFVLADFIFKQSSISRC